MVKNILPDVIHVYKYHDVGFKVVTDGVRIVGDTGYTRTALYEASKSALAQCLENESRMSSENLRLKDELGRIKQSHAELLKLCHNLTWIAPDACIERMKQAISNAEKVINNEH